MAPAERAAPLRRPGEAGLEPTTAPRNDPPVRVDKQRDDHRRHHCADEQAQLGSRAHDLRDEAPDDPGENGVDHPDDRGRAGNQTEDPVLRAWAVRLGQSSLIVVMARHEIGLEPRRDLEIGVTETIQAGQEPEVLDPGVDEADVGPHPMKNATGRTRSANT